MHTVTKPQLNMPLQVHAPHIAWRGQNEKWIGSTHRARGDERKNSEKRKHTKERRGTNKRRERRGEEARP